MNKNPKAFLMIIGFFTLGICFNGLIYYLYSNNLIINEVISGTISIEVVMAFIQILFTLVGLILGVI